MWPDLGNVPGWGIIFLILIVLFGFPLLCCWFVFSVLAPITFWHKAFTLILCFFVYCVVFIGEIIVIGVFSSD